MPYLFIFEAFLSKYGISMDSRMDFLKVYFILFLQKWGFSDYHVGVMWQLHFTPPTLIKCIWQIKLSVTELPNGKSEIILQRIYLSFGEDIMVRLFSKDTHNLQIVRYRGTS